MNDADYFLSVAQQGLWVVALVSVPLLIPALVIGLLIGMVQAATSINEATLSFVPKLIVVAVCLALFGSAMMALMVDFTHDTFMRIPEIAR